MARLHIAALASFLLLVSSPAAVRGQRTCAAVAASLQTGPCRDLESAASSLSLGNAECPELKRLVRTLPRASDTCCPDLRDFVTLGCSCDPDVLMLLQLAGATQEQIIGAVRIAQTAECSSAANGGPMLDPCTNSVGCPPNAQRRMLL